MAHTNSTLVVSNKNVVYVSWCVHKELMYKLGLWSSLTQIFNIALLCISPQEIWNMSWTCLCIVFVRYFAFTHIHQGYITGTTWATIRLPQCQWISSKLSRLMLLLLDISTYCKMVAWWCQMATCNVVIIVSCNGLLPLPLPMLTYHERSPLPFTPVQCLLEHFSEGRWVKLAVFFTDANA